MSSAIQRGIRQWQTLRSEAENKQRRPALHFPGDDRPTCVATLLSEAKNKQLCHTELVKVQQLFRFPVKSLQGESLDSCEVTEFGLRGDRSWSIVDLSTEKSLTARRCPELLFASATVHRASDGSDEVAVTLPDGTDTADNAALSSWLEREVALVRAADDQIGTYETQLDFETEVGEWFDWQGPAGSFHDSTRTRVSLVSAQTARDWDLRRFRINVILDAPGDDDLVGNSLQVGVDLRLDVVKKIDRCVVTTRPQPGLDRDLSVLRTIIAERGNFLGVGALVASPGTIAVGDTVSS